jgi:hypothetical protein
LDYYSKSAGTATSATVSGLTTGGMTIYVRLWTAKGSVWSYLDYTYKTAP